MRRTRIIFFLALSFLLPVCCPDAQDDLDIVRQLKPGDAYLKAALVSLHFLREVSTIATIDTTYAAVIARYQLPTSASGCPDGRFTAASPRDAYDYRHAVTITIRNEKIVAVTYDEVSRDDVGKRDDADYNEAMSTSGTSPAIAYPLYEEQLVQKQDIRDIDSITGASYTNYRFRYVVMLALMKAQLENKK